MFAETKLENKDDVAKIKDNKVCIVGMGPIVNKEVAVDDLTIEQLKGIFTGTITNWSEVGGADAEIVVINRASGSGTRATFETAVLQGEKVPSTFTPAGAGFLGHRHQDGRQHPRRHLLRRLLLLR